MMVKSDLILIHSSVSLNFRATNGRYAFNILKALHVGNHFLKWHDINAGKRDPFLVRIGLIHKMDNFYLNLQIQ